MSEISHNRGRFELHLSGIGVLSFLLFGGIPPAYAETGLSAGTKGLDEHTVRIHNRQFIPHVLHLRVGQKTRLILKNEDAELHAFVPDALFVRTNVQVSGNGAPQFGDWGFRRVLLPMLGQTELEFTPKEAGSFPFFCDLPGHVMNGTVVVEE